MDRRGQEQIALHRWAVIAEAASDRLTPAERGALARQIAARAHTHPDGSARRYSRGTIDRWLRAWRKGGLEALKPSPRADTGVVRAHPGAVRRGRRAAVGAARPLGRADLLDPVSPARDRRCRADHPRPAAPRRAAPRSTGRRAEDIRPL
ncbi:MAG: helix-turn-helix domain-containing protein [Micromonosporaceae bacterium]